MLNKSLSKVSFHSMVKVGQSLGLGTDRLRDILGRMPQARVAVLGDFGVDAYWFLDADRRDRSVETGLPIRAVRRQRYGLAGAGNIVANLRALGVGEVRPLGVVGNDPFGRELLRLLESLGVSTAGIIVSSNGWETQVYAKPHLQDQELERLDFGCFNTMDEETASRLMDASHDALRDFQTVILNQQVFHGVLSGAMIPRVRECVEAHPEHIFLLNSRDYSREFQKVVMQLNYRETADYLGVGLPAGDPENTERAEEFACALFQKMGRPAFVTCSAEGIALCDHEGARRFAALRSSSPVDYVGAGDTVSSALAAALDLGVSSSEAAVLANCAAGVTVRKLRETGTASRLEILKLAEEFSGQ